MKDLQNMKNTEYQSPCCTVLLLQTGGVLLAGSVDATIGIDPMTEEDWG